MNRSVRHELRRAVEFLARAPDHSDSAALDAELLLARALGVTREELYTHPERSLTKAQIVRFRALIRRRVRHEPIAYILGEKDFYGMRLKVTRDVLIPRPETEELVEAAESVIANEVKQSRKTRLLRLSAPRNDVTVIDVGTGSGAVAIAIARSFAPLRMTKKGYGITNVPKIIATDVSRRALAVARENAKRQNVLNKVKFVRCDLLPKVRGGVVIVANLPYLPTELWRKTAPEIKKFEPRGALDGGNDGLDVYRRLLDCFVVLRTPRNDGGGWLLLAEMLPSQMRTFTSEVRRRFPRAKVQRVGPMIIQVSPALN